MPAKHKKPSAMLNLATSLERMAAFYSSHPTPGHIRPIDAIQMALSDVRAAAIYADQGKVWVKAGVWETAS